MHSVMILAAGLGSRLLPLTEECPKAFLRAGSRTLIERSLDALHDQGLRHVTLVIGYLREVFRRDLGSRYRGLSIHYVESPGWRSAGQALSFQLALERSDLTVVAVELSRHSHAAHETVPAAKSALRAAEREAVR